MKHSLVLIGILLISTVCHAADWPNWRGPNHNGISDEIGWQVEWPEDDPPIAWKAQIGMGYAAISVADGKAWTVSNVDEQDHIWCFNAETGEELWKHIYPEPLNPQYYEGGASATPTYDAGVVYSLSRSGKVFALDAATGEVKWQKNVAEETGAPLTTWGFVGSPRVHGDLLLLNIGGGGAALKKDSGELVWFSSKEEAGYSTPQIYTQGGKEFAIFSSGRDFNGRLAATGDPAWAYKWLTRYGVNAADPIVSGDKVFISSGYGKGSALLDISGGEAKEIYKSKVMENQMNPCVLVGDYLYGCDGNDGDNSAALKCITFATGEEQWAFPGVGPGSQMVAGKHLIVLSARGELMFAPVSPEEFEPIFQMQVLGGRCWTVPVLANGRIYVRNNDRGDVVCLDVRGKP